MATQVQCELLEAVWKNEVPSNMNYNVVAIHPHCSWVFLVQHCNHKLLAYDMDSKKVRALCSLTQSSALYSICPLLLGVFVLANKQ